MEASDQEFWRQVALARDGERLFPVRSNKYCAFYAGHRSDGTLILIGRTGAEKILVLFFDEMGFLYDIQRRILPVFQQPPEEQDLKVNDAEFHEYLRKEFDFKPGLVRVRPFMVADGNCEFRLGPLPLRLEKHLAEPQPDNFPPELQAWLQAWHSASRESIRQYLARGVCALEWGMGSWDLDADGVADHTAEQ